MRLLCRIRGHRPASPEVFNEGLFFSTCAGCSSDIIRQKGGRWYPVPLGYRVAWSADGKHTIAPHRAIFLAHEERR
jgi:hypothetical protein